MRLDTYLAYNYPLYSRSTLKKLILDGSVTVNGELKKSNYEVKEKDNIKINFSNLELPKSNIVIPIIYQDNDILVIDKPAGILSHSKGAYNPEVTVANWLENYLPFNKDQSPKDAEISHSLNSTDKILQRSGIVHRLDRATSGVMILAKNDTSEIWLKKQFSDRLVKKTYVAIVEGIPKLPEATLDWPIERSPNKPQTFIVATSGRPAKTHYIVQKTFPKLEAIQSKSLLLLAPTTGRTHQLRVHLKHLGHPIVGDSLYGQRSESRMLLHAKSLEVTLPNGELRVFESKLPKEFNLRSIIK